MYSCFILFFNKSRRQTTERPVESTIDGQLELKNKYLQLNLARVRLLVSSAQNATKN